MTRLGIALLLTFGLGLAAASAEHSEVVCIPIKVPDQRCDPAALNYNRAPPWCIKS